MRETVFVRMIEHEGYDYQNGNLDLSQVLFEVIKYNPPPGKAKVRPPGVLKDLLEEFANIFKEKLEGLPPCCSIEHNIQLQGSLPKLRPIYFLMPLKDDTLFKHLEDPLAFNTITPSKSPFGALVFFVSKPNNFLQLESIYRALNKMTIKNKYPFHSLMTCLTCWQVLPVFPRLT